MKTFLACMSTAAIVLLGVAAFAHAGQQAVTPKQFAALSKRVAALEKTDKTVVGYIGSCFDRWAAIGRYGPGGSEGYLYGFSDGTVQTTSALDINRSGTPNFFVPAPTSDCSLNLTPFRSLARRGHHGINLQAQRVSPSG